MVITDGRIRLDQVNRRVVGPGGERVNDEAIQSPPRGNGGWHSSWGGVDQAMREGVRHHVQIPTNDPPRGEVPLIRNGRQGDLPVISCLHNL